MAGSGPPRQLAFTLPHAESLTRDNFLEGPANAAALALVDAWPEWPSRTMMLVGPEGSGKSHLAAIWADESGAQARGEITQLDVHGRGWHPAGHQHEGGLLAREIEQVKQRALVDLAGPQVLDDERARRECVGHVGRAKDVR